MCFPLMSRTLIYVHVNIILDFPITYRNTSVLCQSECACLHKTVNLIVFLVKSNETTYPKGKAFMQMYRVVPQQNEAITIRNYTFILFFTKLLSALQEDSRRQSI